MFTKTIASALLIAVVFVSGCGETLPDVEGDYIGHYNENNITYVPGSYSGLYYRLSPAEERGKFHLEQFIRKTDGTGFDRDWIELVRIDPKTRKIYRDRDSFLLFIFSDDYRMMEPFATGHEYYVKGNHEDLEKQMQAKHEFNEAYNDLAPSK